MISVLRYIDGASFLLRVSSENVRMRAPLNSSSMAASVPVSSGLSLVTAFETCCRKDLGVSSALGLVSQMVRLACYGVAPKRSSISALTV